MAARKLFLRLEIKIKSHFRDLRKFVHPVDFFLWLGSEVLINILQYWLTQRLESRWQKNVGWSIFDLQLLCWKKITTNKSYLQFFLPWRVEILQMATRNFKMATRNISKSPFSDLKAKKKFSNWLIYFHYFTKSPSRGLSPFIWTNWNPFIPNMLWPYEVNVVKVIKLMCMWWPNKYPHC